ncbi:hypothetical protein Efla_007869 [Eimeria flavescens]
MRQCHHDIDSELDLNGDECVVNDSPHWTASTGRKLWYWHSAEGGRRAPASKLACMVESAHWGLRNPHIGDCVAQRSTVCGTASRRFHKAVSFTMEREETAA